MSLRKTYLAATALVVAAGFTGLAVAQARNTHVLTMRLPDGSMEQIRYQGDQAPQIRLEAEPTAFAVLAPTAFELAPFAELERISAAMDREAAGLLQQVEAGQTMSLGPDGPIPVDFARLPPGASGFTMVSTSTGNGVCTRSFEYRSLGDGKPPKVVSHASGDCGGATGAAPAAHSGAPAAAIPVAPNGQDPHLVQAAYRTGER